jgi:hypothetical protein
MEVRVVSETLEIHSIFTRLIAQEDFILFNILQIDDLVRDGFEQRLSSAPKKMNSVFVLISGFWLRS